MIRLKATQEVLISIRPEFVEKILAVEKAYEIRKTAPMAKLPFKLYIYETKRGCGAVVAECDCVDIIESDKIDVVSKLGCLSVEKTTRYLEGGNALLWKLENLKAYEKTLTLEDFDLLKAPQSWCYIKNIK